MRRCQFGISGQLKKVERPQGPGRWEESSAWLGEGGQGGATGSQDGVWGSLVCLEEESSSGVK